MKPGEAQTRVIFDFRMKYDYHLTQAVIEKMCDIVTELVADDAWEMWIVPKHLMKGKVMPT